MATFVNDTFTDASTTVITAHTGETGATWTKHTSFSPATAPKIDDSNRLMSQTAGTAAVDYASGVPASADYDVACVFDIVSGTFDLTGICGRIDTAANTMYIVRHDGSGNFTLLKNVTGTGTTLGTYSPGLTAIGTGHTLRLSMSGSNLTVFVDGVSRITASDSAISAAGKAGVFLRGASTNSAGVHMASFTASDPVTQTDFWVLT